MARKPTEDTPSPYVEWSKAKTSRAIARAMGVAPRMVRQMLAEQTIRNRRRSRNTWSVDLDEIPPESQVEFGGSDPTARMLATLQSIRAPLRSVALRCDTRPDAG